MNRKKSTENGKWLLIFYSVPAKPVNNRMSIRRKLAKAGAVQLKGSVYMLPYRKEHYIFFQKVIGDVSRMGGEGAFVHVDNIETIPDGRIVSQFIDARAEDYNSIEKGADEAARTLGRIKLGGDTQSCKGVLGQLNKLHKEYLDTRKIDFFPSETSQRLEEKLLDLEAEITALQCPGDRKPDGAPAAPIIHRHIEDYQGKVWVTRKRPYVDRMVSAWLIRKFIDKEAVFKFIDEDEVNDPDKGVIAFDIKGGEFTHAGGLCTFEVLIKAFGIKGKAMRKVARIVHELDLKDEKHKNPEAKGVGDILLGIGKTAGDDNQALEKGIAVIEMLYASKV